MFHLFLLFDIFGTKTGFYHQGYRDYHSSFGGIISIIIFLIIIIIGFIFSIELSIKTNPKVSSARQKNQHPSKVFYPDDIFFMFTLSDNYSPLLDERIYRPIGQISTKLNDSDNILIRKTISLEICSKVFNESYKYYEAMEDLNLNNFYCISLNKSKNNDIDKNEFYINEFWGNNGFQMLQIKLTKLFSNC